MKSTTYTLEFLTPCFCAGADQERAEIRAPSIRGQLRWWFRALGGTPAEERTVFGAVAGDGGTSSSLAIRCRTVETRPWQLPNFSPNDVESYVYYFASVSGTTTRGAKGPRWAAGAMLGPGTKVEVAVIQKRPLTPPLQSALDDALQAFLACGSIGLRATRGLGAFHATDKTSNKPVIPSDALLAKLRVAKFAVELRTTDYADDKAIAKIIGSLVKGTRKAQGWKAGKTPSPLGASSPRQSSAILFRPVRTESGNRLRLLILEAPHARVLGTNSRRPSPTVGKSPPIGLTAYTPPPRTRS